MILLFISFFCFLGERVYLFSVKWSFTRKPTNFSFLDLFGDIYSEGGYGDRLMANATNIYVI